MKAHAGHVIASGLLRTYLGWDAGGRVHAGAVTRGSMERMRAAIWYADIRGFTTLSDSAPGPAVIDLLNDAFEALTAALRERGGQVLKFVGDAMLATFSFEEADRGRDLRPRDRRRDRGDPQYRSAEPRTRRGRRAADRGRFRASCRRGAVRQCRRGRPARLHRHRPGDQRGRPHRGALPAARPAGAGVGRVRGHRARKRPAARVRSACTRSAASRRRRSCSRWT